MQLFSYSEWGKRIERAALTQVDLGKTVTLTSSFRDKAVTGQLTGWADGGQTSVAIDGIRYDVRNDQAALNVREQTHIHVPEESERATVRYVGGEAKLIEHPCAECGIELNWDVR